MNNLRVNTDDIVFMDEISIFEEYDTIYAYLCETDIIDKVAGLYTDVLHDDDFQVNYYGVYDYNNKTFKVEIDLTLYCTYNQLKKDFPLVADKIIDIVEKNKDGKEEYLNLSINESELFFDTFKKFCLDEFQAMNYKVMTFEELIEEVKEELNLK